MYLKYDCAKEREERVISGIPDCLPTVRDGHLKVPERARAACKMRTSEWKQWGSVNNVHCTLAPNKLRACATSK